MSVTVKRMWATAFALITIQCCQRGRSPRPGGSGGHPVCPPSSDFHRPPTGVATSPCQNPVVQIGMTMPVMEPNLDAATLTAWARVIDGGPFSSLCWGERIAFDNPDSLTMLGAMAALTDRVRLVTTVN